MSAISQSIHLSASFYFQRQNISPIINYKFAATENILSDDTINFSILNFQIIKLLFIPV